MWKEEKKRTVGRGCEKVKSWKRWREREEWVRPRRKEEWGKEVKSGKRMNKRK